MSIENARRRRNISQAELAELVEVSPRTVMRWEQEKTAPDILTAMRISEVLGIPVEDLFA